VRGLEYKGREIVSFLRYFVKKRGGRDLPEEIMGGDIREKRKGEFSVEGGGAQKKKGAEINCCGEAKLRRKRDPLGDIPPTLGEINIEGGTTKIVGPPLRKGAHPPQ